MKSPITIACGQFQPVFGNTAQNLAIIESFTRKSNADLIVFPELSTSGYEIRNRTEVGELALDPAHSQEFHHLRALTRELNIHLVLGFPEKAEVKFFNSAALIEPSGKTTIYRKLHLFDREKNLFDRGDSPPPVIETAIGKIGLMICFDWIFPEVSRLLALNSAQIICHPSNLVLTYCQQAMFARSVENGVFTATCNRIGSETRTDRTLTFTGASQILSNRGALLAQAGKDTEEIISAEIAPEAADNKSITALNDIFQDRRIEFFHPLID